jgi:hypothetical protein
MNSMLEVFSRVIRTLEAHDIEYMVVGSIASMIYGEPRLTGDMDIVVELKPRMVPQLEGMFPEHDFYLPPREILSQEVLNRGQFNILDQSTMLKIDVIVRKNSPHGLSEFSRKIKRPFLPDFDVFVAAVEDVIIKKLYYYREGGSSKHLHDIRGMLAHTRIDTDYLDNWVAQLNLNKEWVLAQT